MTTGEKIRYCRERIGITQGRLAELTGIHPVSIRKYETNKMQPQPSQLERLATALGVSYNALNGTGTGGMRLETVGDLMGVLMVLCNSDILRITGERGADDLLKEDTVSLRFNPVLGRHLSARLNATGDGNKSASLDGLLVTLKSRQMLRDLLRWEQVCYRFKKSKQKYGETANEATQAALAELGETREKIELELQRSQALLDTSAGITVSIIPDYLGE